MTGPAPSNLTSKSVKSGIERLAGVLTRFVSSKLFLYITFGWFIAQAVFIALTVAYGVPPDETYHFTYIKLFAENSPSPFLSDLGSYNILKEVTRDPFFLYHYLLSFPFLLIRNLPYAFIILRFFNILFGVGALVLVYKIARFSQISRLVTNLSIFMLGNTMMFVFLFSSNNYDSLFIFLSLLSTLLLLGLLKSLQTTKLLLLILTLLAGLMVKVNFIPVAAIVLFIFGVRYVRSPQSVVQALWKSFSRDKWLNALITLAILVLTILFANRYLVNLARYQTYAPKCERVLQIDECRKNKMFVRNEQIYKYDKRAPKLNEAEYTLGWANHMLDRTYGVFSHKQFTPNRIISLYVKIVAVLGIATIVRFWKQKDKALSILIVISLFSVAVLLIENYMIYQASGRPSFAIHGRYLFAALPLIYLVCNHYIIKGLRNNIIGASFIVISIAIFALSSLPTYLIKTTPDWYRQKINLLIR